MLKSEIIIFRCNSLIFRAIAAKRIYLFEVLWNIFCVKKLNDLHIYSFTNFLISYCYIVGVCWNSSLGKYFSVSFISVIFALAANSCQVSSYLHYEFLFIIYYHFFTHITDAKLKFILIDSELQSWFVTEASNLRTRAETGFTRNDCRCFSSSVLFFR